MQYFNSAVIKQIGDLQTFTLRGETLKRRCLILEPDPYLRPWEYYSVWIWGDMADLPFKQGDTVRIEALVLLDKNGDEYTTTFHCYSVYGNYDVAPDSSAEYEETMNEEIINIIEDFFCEKCDFFHFKTIYNKEQNNL